MSGCIEGSNRRQSTLFPEWIDDYVGEDGPVRVIDVFIDRLDISGLGVKAQARATGRPGYHPRTTLKIYVYGYFNQVHSSRRLEQEVQRNLRKGHQRLGLRSPHPPWPELRRGYGQNETDAVYRKCGQQIIEDAADSLVV